MVEHRIEVVAVIGQAGVLVGQMMVQGVLMVLTKVIKARHLEVGAHNIVVMVVANH